MLDNDHSSLAPLARVEIVEPRRWTRFVWYGVIAASSFAIGIGLAPSDAPWSRAVRRIAPASARSAEAARPVDVRLASPRPAPPRTLVTSDDGDVTTAAPPVVPPLPAAPSAPARALAQKASSARPAAASAPRPPAQKLAPRPTASARPAASSAPRR